MHFCAHFLQAMRTIYDEYNDEEITLSKVGRQHQCSLLEKINALCLRKCGFLLPTQDTSSGLFQQSHKHQAPSVTQL